MNHLLTLSDWTPGDIMKTLDMARDIKAHPDKYAGAMNRRTLLMIFEKPSLRTRISFETGMTRMGGHAIYYDMSTSPMGAGKETLHDTVKTAARYVDLIMARLFKHAHIIEFAQHSDVPVINALTDYAHPCQIMADLLTILEKKGRLKGLKVAYMGDSNNNVTHSLMLGCAMTGADISIGCPEGTDYEPRKDVFDEARRFASDLGTTITITHDAGEAADGADVIYTDSWMSYHIPKSKLDERISLFKPYQVNPDLMSKAASGAIFMNCLPAMRGYEQTEEVIDGPQSVVFDQAENRMHAQNAIMISLLKNAGRME